MHNTLLHPRYDLFTRLLHWLLAVLLVVVFGLGLWLDGLGLFDSRQALASLWHTSLGVLAGLLMLLRLFWRWRQPAAPAIGSRLEQHLARLVQGGLYGLVLLAVCSGYLLATGSGRVLEWFGVVSVPALLSLDAAALANIRDLHGISVWLLAALSGLHLLAVLKHQLLDRQPLWKRML